MRRRQQALKARCAIEARMFSLPLLPALALRAPCRCAMLPERFMLSFSSSLSIYRAADRVDIYAFPTLPPPLRTATTSGRPPIMTATEQQLR